ncbi:MAG TPA: hypothetical protein VK171_10200, partial [Fimbriimonas sp.]|nr:hypothetical protein [Fimbriimonas sp.]
MNINEVFPHRWCEQMRKGEGFSHFERTIEDVLDFVREHEKSPFFPAYTNHGIQHLKAVAKNCDELIGRDALSLLTSSDFALLAVAIAIHDIGMCLGKDELCAILSDPNDEEIQREWRRFVDETSHWKKHDCQKTLGIYPPQLKSIDPRDYNDDQCLFVGEFLRRKHGEIALRLATTQFHNIKAITEHPTTCSDFFKLAGLIAHSHTIDIGSSMEQLAEEFAVQEQIDCGLLLDAHVPFLKCLLRIADYAEFRSFSSQYFFSRHVSTKSRISILENDTMAAIKSTHWRNSGKEELMLEFSSDDPHVVMNVDRYQKGIETEIHRCWSILSEYYSKYSDPVFALSGLSIRKVKFRNLKEKTFLKAFYKKPLQITVDKSQIIYLLARPL